MKTKLFYVIAIFFMLYASIGLAQEKTITGTVSDSGGLPLPGVNILIKDTSLGTQSDFDGNYSIKTKIGQVLTFSYLGFTTQEITVTTSKNKFNITLTEDAESLGEVVITAQGIKRDKRVLGFGQTTVQAEALEERPNADLAKVLQGKVAGVQISQTGVTGGGSGITIRGSSSINGNNQALIVVDGVPINSGSDDDGFTGAGATDSNRLLDIDPNNIADISVLKGLAATVLYGNQGLNGVIVITTKSGKSDNDYTDKKLEMTVLSNTYAIQVANLPDFQNTHGSGFFLGNINQANGSFGPRFDGEIIPNILSNNAALQGSFPELFDDPNTPDIIEGGQAYSAIPDNVRDFFRTGLGRTLSIGASKSFDKGSINFNYSNTIEDGFIPFNKLRRDNYSIGGTAQLSNKFTVSGAFNFVQNNVDAPSITAANGANAFSTFERLLFIPRNFDINNSPFQDPTDGSNVYYLAGVDNPRWVLNNSLSESEVNRIFNNLSLNYAFTDNISLTYRYGLDVTNEKQSFFINRGSSDGNTIYQNGYLRLTNIIRQQTDHSVIANGAFELSDDFDLNVILGGNSNRRTFDRNGTAYQGQVLFDNQTARNFEDASNVDPFTGAPIDFFSEINIFGFYGQTELDYRNYLYLTLSARNDYASLLEDDNNSIFYPSAAVSFIPTSAFPEIKSNFLNYLKVRANAASGAQFPDRPFSTRPVINQNANAFGNGGTITQSISNFVPNPDLEGATFTDYEFGIETKLWDNRIRFESSIYRRIASDQIFQQAIAAETGATSTLVNIGETETDGIELDFSITPVRTANFEWNLNSNFFAYETIVTELPEDVQQLAIGGFTNIGNFAIEGEPLGVIVGSFALQDENGNFLIDPSNGEVIPNSQFGIPDKIIGDPNPDWTATIINNFKYKNFTLSGQVEYRHGGDIYSLTAQNLLFRGVVDIDGIDRDFYAASVPGVLAQLDDDGSIVTVDSDGDGVVDGVQSSGNPNNIILPLEDTIFNNLEQNAAENIYDGSFIRLRELSLTYDLSEKALGGTPFGALSFKIYGQNLLFDAPNFPDALNYDIEAGSTGVGNASGLDFQTAPSAQSFGFSVKASF